MKSPGDQVRCKNKCCKSGTRCKKCPVVWKKLSKQGFAERRRQAPLRRDRRRAQARAQGRARLDAAILSGHGHLPRHGWRRVPRLAPVRRAAAPRPPRDLRRQRRDRDPSPTSSTSASPEFRFLHARHHRAVLRRRAGRRRLPLREPGVADRLPAAAAAHAQGRLARHAPHARPGQGAPRALRDRVDLGGLRRSEGPPAARVLLGPRQPDRPARRLRRGQALRRGADDGLPPPAGRRHGDRADLQHVRPADAAARRPGDPDVPAPGAAGPADHGLRRRARRRGRSATSRT